MNNIFLECFKKAMSDSVQKYAEVPDEIQEKYKGVFMSSTDQFDIINQLWSEEGFCSYKNGLFSLLNPDEYSDLARQFKSVSKTAIVFARTAVGGLFLFDKKSGGDVIVYLNVHTGVYTIVSTKFSAFFGNNILSNNWWIREAYGKIELEAIAKHGPLEPDECLAFVPALALGGSESISKMQKVKLKEHLVFLAQL